MFHQRHLYEPPEENEEWREITGLLIKNCSFPVEEEGKDRFQDE